MNPNRPADEVAPDVEVPTLDYRTVTSERRSSGKVLMRVSIVLFGISLPYLARVPGSLTRGPDWLDSYLEMGVGGFVFFGSLNAFCWGAVLAFTLSYRHATTALFPAVLGFAFPACAHATLDLSSDAQAAIALIFIPIYSLPLVAAGGLIGLAVEWVRRRRRVIYSGHA